MKRLFWLLVAVLLLTGCAETITPKPTSIPATQPAKIPQDPRPMGPPMNIQTQPAQIPEITVTPLVGKELFSDRDYDDSYDADGCRILLQGDTASCTDSSVVIRPGSITITKKGTYILTGTLDAGMVIVDTDTKAKVQLVLEDAAIHNQTSAAIYVAQADKVFLTLPEGTENVLSNGGSFIPVDDSNIDAVIFSRDDLTINGSGSLRIQSPAGHGIVSKDEVTITDGVFSIDAASHGITGQDCVSIDGAVLDIRCGKDAIQSQNDTDAEKGFAYLANTVLTCEAADNGIRTTGILQIDSGTLNLDCIGDALHSEKDLIVRRGDITITTQDDGFHADNLLAFFGGTVRILDSYEGLEAKTVLVAGGDIALSARDDGVNAAGGNDRSGFDGHRGGDRFREGDDSCVLLTGGALAVNAAGDGIDSNGGLYLAGCHVTVEGPIDDMNGPLDYSGDSAITGGSILATGSAQMAQSLYPQDQGVIFLTFAQQPGGTNAVISDSNGNILMTACPEKQFSSMVASCPEIHSGKTYRVSIGNTEIEIQAQ